MSRIYVLDRSPFRRLHVVLWIPFRAFTTHEHIRRLYVRQCPAMSSGVRLSVRIFSPIPRLKPSATISRSHVVWFHGRFTRHKSTATQLAIVTRPRHILRRTFLNRYLSREYFVIRGNVFGAGGGCGRVGRYTQKVVPYLYVVLFYSPSSIIHSIIPFFVCDIIFVVRLLKNRPQLYVHAYICLCIQKNDNLQNCEFHLLRHPFPLTGTIAFLNNQTKLTNRIFIL